MSAIEEIEVGVIEGIQFAGYGPDSGEAEIIFFHKKPNERRFVLHVNNEKDGSLDGLSLALKAMWRVVPVELRTMPTTDLPDIVGIRLLEDEGDDD